MKIAISIPDLIFEIAKQLATQLGISRSQLYRTAISAYLKKHRAEPITERLNQLYAVEDSSLDEVVQRLQSISLRHKEW